MNIFSEKIQQKYQDKNILILGFGREGKSTYQFLRQIFPEKNVILMDSAMPETHYLQDLQKYDVIFKTPGIPISLPELQTFLHDGKIITSQLNEFLEVYRDQMVGVTGTKGKSTTSALIHHLLTTAGRKSQLLGNIGTPVFEGVNTIDSDTLLVVEMSSYALETVKTSPHIALFLNIFSEHLNYHRSFSQYRNAKANITVFQNEHDVLIYNEDFTEINNIARTSVARKVPFGQKSAALQFIKASAHLPKTIQHFNVLPAVLAVKELSIPDEKILAGLKTFSPLPHRLEKVAEKNSITFIDDTLATIPEATCAAIDALSRVDVIILGGFDRGIDYTLVVDKVVQQKIPTIIFFKPSGEKMLAIMQSKYSAAETPKTFFAETMQEAVKLSFAHAKPGGVVLLSPSSPSHGLFKDYEDKAAQFKKYIAEF